MYTSQGFSVVELLISMTIVIVLLGLITMGLITGSGTVLNMNSQAELLNDSRLVSQVMADSINRAVYIYRPGSQLSLQTSNSYSVKNPQSNTNLWTIGTDPIIAFIEAAEDTKASASCTPTTPKACLHFVAYYPVLRETVSSNATGTNHPGKDDGNKDKWVLYEYRLRLAQATFDETTPSPPLSLSGGFTDILADYVKPDSISISFLSCIDSKGQLEPCSVAQSPHYLASVKNGEYKFSAEVKRKKVIKTSELSFAIVPKNLYQK